MKVFGRARSEPDRDPELVGDGGDVERELPLLVEADEVYLRQVGDLQRRDPKALILTRATKQMRRQRGKGGSVGHTRRHAEMWWCTMGWPASGKSGLGTLSDSGRNRVPAHPTTGQSETKPRATRRGVGTGEGRAGADLRRTFGGAADHDDGDDALLGAGHGCARRLGGGAEPEWRCARAGVVTGEI